MPDATGQGTWCPQSRESGSRPNDTASIRGLKPAASLYPVAWRGLAAL